MTRPIITIICHDERTRDLLWRHAELTGCECYHVGDQGWRVTVHEPEMVTNQTRGSATGQRGERGTGGYGDPGRWAAEMLISMVFDEQQQEPVKPRREPHSTPLPCPSVDASRYMVGCGRLF